MLFNPVCEKDMERIFRTSELLKELDQKSNEIEQLAEKLESKDKKEAKACKVEIQEFITKEARIKKLTSLLANLSLIILIISIIISRFYSENAAMVILFAIMPIVLIGLMIQIKSESDIADKSKKYQGRLGYFKKRAA